VHSGEGGKGAFNARLPMIRAFIGGAAERNRRLLCTLCFISGFVSLVVDYEAISRARRSPVLPSPKCKPRRLFEYRAIQSLAFYTTEDYPGDAAFTVQPRLYPRCDHLYAPEPFTTPPSIQDYDDEKKPSNVRGERTPRTTSGRSNMKMLRHSSIASRRDNCRSLRMKQVFIVRVLVHKP